MADLRLSRGAVARLALELALAACTIWLVIQNALLFAFGPWPHLPEPLRVAGALVRASLLVAETVWPWVAVSVLIASAAAMGLVGARGEKEAHRG